MNLNCIQMSLYRGTGYLEKFPKSKECHVFICIQVCSIQEQSYKFNLQIYKPCKIEMDLKLAFTCGMSNIAMRWGSADNVWTGILQITLQEGIRFPIISQCNMFISTKGALSIALAQRSNPSIQPVPLIAFGAKSVPNNIFPIPSSSLFFIRNTSFSLQVIQALFHFE